jgi:hypothetical protein
LSGYYFIKIGKSLARELSRISCQVIEQARGRVPGSGEGKKFAIFFIR